MPKSKNSPALYELMTRHPPKGRPKPSPPPRQPRPPKRSAGDADRRSAADTARARAPAPARREASSPSTAPASRLSRLLRNPAKLSALIACSAIVVFAGFMVGNRWNPLAAPTVRRPAGDALERARRERPHPEVLNVFGSQEGPRNGTAEAAEPSAGESLTENANKPVRLSAGNEPSVSRQIGLNYIVIESFGPDRQDDARLAREFLARHGIESTIERSGPGWLLVSVQGFGASDPARERMVERIRGLGRAFFDQGGSYKFICYAKLYQGKPW